MRIYQNTLEMVKEVERDLFEMGIRYQTATVQDQEVADNPDFQTIELFGYAYTLTKYEDLSELIQYLNLNAAWLKAEERERLGGLFGMPVGATLNPGTAWKENKQLWEPFLRDGKFSYSYAERWQEQISYVVNELRLRPNSRQAIMTMYDRHQDMMNWGGRDRVPCSLTYQFMIRANKLHLIYNQRSCDFIKFFGADVFLTIQLMKHIAEELRIEAGNFTHFLGSLHAFHGDLKDRNIF